MEQAMSSSPKYLKLYNYLKVLDESQIIKLRKVVTGILDMSVFSPEEIRLLEAKVSPSRIAGTQQ